VENVSDVTIALAIQCAIRGREIVRKIERSGEIYWDELLEFVASARILGCATDKDVDQIKKKECDVARLKEILQCIESRIPTNAPSRPRVRI
jgi:hypothetical protein